MTEVNTVGQRIREAREAKGWTIRRLASESGLTEATVCRVEAGKRNAGAWTIVALARALGIDPHSLDQRLASTSTAARQADDVKPVTPKAPAKPATPTPSIPPPIHLPGMVTTLRRGPESQEQAVEPEDLPQEEPDHENQRQDRRR